MNRIGIAIFAAALAMAPGLAVASQQGTQVIKNWKTSDKCAQQAQAAFPDFTAEANAKRDAKLKECLEINRLAPRAPSAPGQ
jgi:Tfp pilus assembly protein FimT